MKSHRYSQSNILFLLLFNNNNNNHKELNDRNELKWIMVVMESKFFFVVVVVSLEAERIIHRDILFIENLFRVLLVTLAHSQETSFPLRSMKKESNSIFRWFCLFFFFNFILWRELKWTCEGFKQTKIRFLLSVTHYDWNWF